MDTDEQREWLLETYNDLAEMVENKGEAILVSSSLYLNVLRSFNTLEMALAVAQSVHEQMIADLMRNGLLDSESEPGKRLN